MYYKLSRLLSFNFYSIKFNCHSLTLYTALDMPNHRFIGLIGNCGKRKLFYIQRKYFNKCLNKFVYVLV